MKKIIFLFAFASFLQVKANNIQVNNISLENLNEVSNWVNVEFDLFWENSWRISSGPSNWDAAWVFMKYRVNNGTWTHAILSQANSTPAAGATMEVTSDGIGALIYRDADGSGNVNFLDNQIRWNFGSTDTNDIIDIQVFAVEMVYVPEGSFYVGGTTGDEANKFHSGGFSTASSFHIQSENALTIANTSGNLYYTATNARGGDQTGTLSASYPKGFNAFYAMKYETTESQWLGFFNSLTETQKTNRDITDTAHKNSDAVVNRNTISWTGGSASATTTAPDRPVSFVNVADINAYMDWTGLRPLSELEYEKACRGPILPKPGEFAWGSSNIASNDYTIVNSGFSSERVTNPETNSGNAMYSLTDGTINGPLRNGIFAASAVNNNREETGGSYYGIMELSGNLYERCVTVGTAQGRSFTGLHGNGIIGSTSGNGTVSNWPNSTTGDGYSFRGGSWLNGAEYIRISDRYDGASVISGGNNRLGFRGARTAP
ncbi:SUMF1/EgtB/PvdO family nonheme iron enzyme [Lacinutrix sp. WUR7]|uniref:formylglycine-generating enzyme family protein n=1 Tax=Lacinutrix sp. WUR7 TaxID=2653681 RepID=UPI00193CD553|nr:SUMF1/EgtB/PvdO family nonheme iron enzyme [Lacinutrix sp. WUR7]QRM89450.1 SUMF1/EgtB/PvdO family nonheme iron enzyme [Lacinutrix sp. WUR7]